MDTITSNSSRKKPVGISIQNLSKSFGPTEVLKNISLEIKPGEIFTLMGPSGSGKSVLLKQIIGLDQPTAGKVEIDGLNASERETHTVFETAMVFQAGALLNSMTVFENLALYPMEHRKGTKKEIAQKVAHTLEMLSIKDAGSRYPSELSGGMKKRVAIARALVMEPQLLLYDEPTSELDPTMAATISEIIGLLRDELGLTSVVVSHDRDLAFAISDRIGIIMEGEILMVDTPDVLKTCKENRIYDFLSPTIDLKKPRFRHL